MGLRIDVKQICTISETGRLYKAVCFVIDYFGGIGFGGCIEEQSVGHLCGVCCLTLPIRSVTRLVCAW